MKLTISGASVVSDGIWLIEMEPRHVCLLGDAGTAQGVRSVVLISDAAFDDVGSTLSFEAERAFPINLGTTSQTIAISLRPKPENRSAAVSLGDVQDEAVRKGDRQFLDMAQRLLPEPMFRASATLLREVRKRSPGDLKRGQARNFSNSPDNFWYVIIQPRIAELSITVRGPVEHFRNMAKVAIKDDRGNTRFKVSSEKDVQAALELIFHAKRRL
ncbi:hypothetical protein [Devosia sp. Root436]|uniref:hypothetical protein n=1 Tax=Devosia sp. Root436 TaxID=1736537 RepID=UPI000A584CFB|nr:hypothetical protein [Devosia sp. Root436]